MAYLKPAYKEIGSDEEILTFNNGTYKGSKHLQILEFLIGFLLLTNIASAVLWMSLLFSKEHSCTEQNCANGYSTEWEPAKASIEFEEVVYTSAFRYNETSTQYYREFDPSDPQYVGPPSPEIDKAWDDLMTGQYLILTESEAMSLENPVPVGGMYIAEVEVMHSLHCLNAIRRSIDDEYYAIHDPHPLPERLRRLHVDHCLEQLRQNIQCASDLTPVVARPYGNGANAQIIGTPQAHTCRSWSSFRKWYTERGETYGVYRTGPEGGTAAWKQNKQFLDIQRIRTRTQETA